MTPPLAVVFDFDGLIVDTESVEFASWKEEFQAHGAELKLEDWIKCVGAGPDAWSVTDHLEGQLSEPVDMDAVVASRLKRCEEMSVDLQPNPGVVRWLDELNERNIPFGIASSSMYNWVDEHLIQLGLRERFEVVVTRDQVPRAKPFPDLYLEACRRLSVPPDQAAAFEDSVNGARAALSAGMITTAVPGPITSGLDFSFCSRIVQSLEDVSWEDLESDFAERAKSALR